jgi:hypothetical protein
MKNTLSHATRPATRIASMALAFAGAFGAAGSAGAETIEDPVIKEGTYVMQVHSSDANDQVAGCMIVSNNGRNSVPSVYDWGMGGSAWCGLSGRVEDVLQNRQAVWRITSVRASSGAHAYVIKSHVNGRCLIRGHGGRASAPSLHLWTELPGGKDAFCGFRDADELIGNGQAAWSLDAERLGWGVLVHSASTGPGNASPGLPATMGFATNIIPHRDPNTGFAAFVPTPPNPWFFIFWPTDFWSHGP